MSIIIGIDPDSKAHGVAVYENGKLNELSSMTLLELMDMFDFGFEGLNKSSAVIHMEDVCANNGIFRTGNNKKVQMSIARRLGMVQQSQIELERLFEYYEIKVVKHKISKKWKKEKTEFEKVTGWTGRSNEDTRSAAYFGFLGCR
jgi:hypothetical protein